jgi:small conductance mechanosensitive channel
MTLDAALGWFAEVMAGPWRYGVALGVAALAFPTAAWLAQRMRGAARRRLGIEGVDATVGVFAAEAARLAVLIGALVLVLTVAGVEPTSVAAVLGAATLAVGLALQSTLANVAAGLLIIVFRLYRVTDFVEIAGRQGTVRLISLFYTELATIQGVKTVVPNALAFSQAFQNLSFSPRRRVDVEVTLAWDSDANTACEVLRSAIGDDARALADPAPEARVIRLTDKGPVVALRVWAAAPDAAALGWDLAGRAHAALRAAGFRSSEADAQRPGG